MNIIRIENGKTYSIIAGEKYKLKANGIALCKKLNDEGIDAVLCINKEGLYCVNIGEFTGKDLKPALLKFSKHGLKIQVIEEHINEVNYEK